MAYLKIKKKNRRINIKSYWRGCLYCRIKLRNKRGIAANYCLFNWAKRLSLFHVKVIFTEVTTSELFGLIEFSFWRCTPANIEHHHAIPFLGSLKCSLINVGSVIMKFLNSLSGNFFRNTFFFLLQLHLKFVMAWPEKVFYRKKKYLRISKTLNYPQKTLFLSLLQNTTE